MKILNWVRSRENQLWEIGFLFVYGVLLAKYICETSLLNGYLYEVIGAKRDSYYLWIRLFMGTIVLAKTVREERYNGKELCLVTVVVAVFWRCVQVAGYMELIDLAILIVGARKVSFQKILLVYVGASAAMIAVIMYGAWKGLYADWVFPKYEGEITIEKHSFGFYYPNEFAAHIFFCFLGWCCLRREKITVPELVVMLAAAKLLQDYCYARTNVMCMIAMAVGMFVWKLLARFTHAYKARFSRWIGIVLAVVPFICCVVMVGLTWKFSWDTPWLVQLDEILSLRLRLGKAAMDRNGITMFGQYIEQVGMSPFLDPTRYNFLDCSYVSIFMRFGIASLAVFGILVIWINVRACCSRNYVLLFVMALCAIQCMMEHHFHEIAYNPLWLAALAVLPEMSDKEKRKRRVTERRYVQKSK